MKYFIPIIFLLLLYAGCRDFMEIPDTGRRIVINGLITNDSLLNVRIGTSAYILNFESGTTERQQDLKDAEVKIYQNENYIDSLYHTYTAFYDSWNVFVPGNYQSQKLIVKEGNEYFITVKAHGLPEANAHTKVPEIVKIESIDTSHIILPPGEFDFSNTGLSCKIHFTDPPNIINYYLLTVNKVPAARPFYSNIEFNCKDPVIEETLHSRVIEGIAFSDKVINGQTYALSLIIRDESIAYVQTAQTNDGKFSLYFRLYSIPEEYFRYIRTLNQYSRNFGNPLADPVMMFSNITGGFGMFTGAAVSSVSINYSEK